MIKYQKKRFIFIFLDIVDKKKKKNLTLIFHSTFKAFLILIIF
jgi:hypothetical protein